MSHLLIKRIIDWYVIYVTVFVRICVDRRWFFGASIVMFQEIGIFGAIVGYWWVVWWRNAWVHCNEWVLIMIVVKILIIVITIQRLWQQRRWLRRRRRRRRWWWLRGINFGINWCRWADTVWLIWKWNRVSSLIKTWVMACVVAVTGILTVASNKYKYKNVKISDKNKTII